MVVALQSSTGASRLLLRSCLEGRFTPLLSTPLLIEYETVLTRPERLAESKLTQTETLRIIDALLNIAEPVDLVFRWRPTGAHPDDELVVETAVNGFADALVTFNIRHMQSAAARFGITVVRPGVLVMRLLT